MLLLLLHALPGGAALITAPLSTLCVHDLGYTVTGRSTARPWHLDKKKHCYSEHKVLIRVNNCRITHGAIATQLVAVRTCRMCTQRVAECRSNE
jgi:hypothetical protein